MVSFITYFIRPSKPEQKNQSHYLSKINIIALSSCMDQKWIVRRSWEIRPFCYSACCKNARLQFCLNKNVWSKNACIKFVCCKNAYLIVELSLAKEKMIFHKSHIWNLCDLHEQFWCVFSYNQHAKYYYLVGLFTADKFNTGVFASDIFIQAKLQSGVFTAGGITEWSLQRLKSTFFGNFWLFLQVFYILEILVILII